jgi:N-acyl homoserine lactone hydrolase
MKRITFIGMVMLIGGLAVVAQAQPVTGVGGQWPRESVRLYVLDGGTTKLPQSMFGKQAYGDSPISLPVMAFLIVHPKGTLLWDTGHSDSLMNQAPDSQSLYQISVHIGVENQLRELGMTPSDVQFLAFSHWHFDHTGNANLFRKSRILSQRDEYEMAFSTVAEEIFGMRPETYESVRENPKTIFMGDHDVFGDGSVEILRASGHTIGSQVLVVRLKSRTLLLSGDLWHFNAQRRFRRVPPFNWNRASTLESIDIIECILKSLPDGELWITHDPEQMKGLDRIPKFYE